MNISVSKSMACVLTRAVLLCLLATSVWATEAELSPGKTVEIAVTNLQNELADRHAFYVDNPRALYALMHDALLPNFDVEYAGKLVLGKAHWPTATADQRTRFIVVFTDFLIRTYSKGVLELRTERMVVFPEAIYSADKSKAQVRTELTIEGGENALVNYSVRWTADRWKIYDIHIDGVSYIQNYRSQFDAEISAQGLEAVIVRLEKEIERADAVAATET